MHQHLEHQISAIIHMKYVLIVHLFVILDVNIFFLSEGVI